MTGLELREETPHDFSAVRDVNEQAFGRDAEGRLVDLLRAGNKPVLSLVATLDGRVVGHILFSPISVSVAPTDFRAVGLAPMSVVPEFQNRGIGSSLVS